MVALVQQMLCTSASTRPKPAVRRATANSVGDKKARRLVTAPYRTPWKLPN